MDILVTGGSGFVGSHIIRQLIENDCCPIVLDNLSNSYRQTVPAGVPFYEADAGDDSVLRILFEKYNMGAVIHCAALVSVNESVAEPSKYYEQNVSQSIALLRACERASVKFFIFSSSAAVYGQPLRSSQHQSSSQHQRSSLIEETAPTIPMSPYGRTKLIFENILSDVVLSPRSQMRYVALRYFNVAGAHRGGEVGQANKKKASHLIKVAAEVAAKAAAPSPSSQCKRNQVEIYGTDYPTRDGTCVRDYIHVDDLARAHVQALNYLRDGGSSDIFNCGYGQGFSVREVLDVMKKLSGSDFKVVESDRRRGDPAELIANPKKIQRTLGWTPQFNDLSVICETALKWEHKLQGGIYGELV